MLQSEFFERTHTTLTGEEYADVECLYNAVKMNKDEFCKRWVSERKNPLFKELADAYIKECNKHRRDIQTMTANSTSLKSDFDNYKKEKEKEVEELRVKIEQNLREFAAKIVRTNFDKTKIYDIIEEEMSIGFIIRCKHQAGIPLSDEEIAYMVGKL